MKLALATLLVAAGVAHADTPKPQGQDFIGDAKLLFRIAACGGDKSGEHPTRSTAEGGAKVDDKVDDNVQKIVERHCKTVNDKLDKFRALYFVKGAPFFAKIEPANLPKTVVYPFGGGDLLSALVAFPDATEITTISLELAGAPRRIGKLSPNELDRSLGALRAEFGGLISVGSNTSENLSNQQQNDLPGQVSSFLLGLVAGGFEPVSMRYFTLDDAGDIHYLDAAEIEAADKEALAHAPKSLKHDWHSPNFSTAFSNVEIQYRKVGDTAIRVHRHFGWNLGDDYLKLHPQLIRHLEKKGQVAILVKGASYLLWRGDFKRTRDYILDHLAWMLSDSTGIPPKFAQKAHMVQDTFGGYDGAFLESVRDNPMEQDMIDLWAKQRRRSLPFRFGYVDMNKQAHLMVTRPVHPNQ